MPLPILHTAKLLFPCSSARSTLFPLGLGDIGRDPPTRGHGAQIAVIVPPITGASCNDTSECKIRSCARLVGLKLPQRALERHLKHRMGEFSRWVQLFERHCPK